jgi:hypothetical protein
LQIDDNAKISAFNITGNGTVYIDGGKTNVCDGTVNATSQLLGTLAVSNCILEDFGDTQIQLVGNNSTIQVQCSSIVYVDGGAGNTLNSEQMAGNNDYIDVQYAGDFVYTGKAGIKDTFTAPVLVEDGGQFTGDGGGGGGGTLTINGAETATNNVSLYVQGGLLLRNTMTFSMGSGLNATSTSSIDTDNLTETITTAANMSCIMNGTVNVDTMQFTYAKLVVNCTNLSFGGTLIAHVSGPNNGTCSQLIVNGKMTLDANSSQLDTPLDGNGNLMGESWTVISATGGVMNNFFYVVPYNSMHWKHNPGDNDYVQLFGYAS